MKRRYLENGGELAQQRRRRQHEDEDEDADMVDREEVGRMRSLRAGVARSYRQGRYTDVVLRAADGATVAAHKVVLAAASKYFADKLESLENKGDGKEEEEEDSNEVKSKKKCEKPAEENNKEEERNGGRLEKDELLLDNFAGDAMKAAVDFLYTQRVPDGAVTASNARQMLAAGEALHIVQLTEEAARQMAGSLCADNAIDVMTHEVFSGSMADNAARYVAENFEVFLTQREDLRSRLLADLDPDSIVNLLQQAGLMLWSADTGLYLDAVEREKRLLAFVLAYVAHDVGRRLPDLSRLVGSLRLPLLAHADALSLESMGRELGVAAQDELPADLKQLLGQFEKLTGKENLAALFTSVGGGKKERQLQSVLIETCRMRLASIPHSTSCSDVVQAQSPWGQSSTFGPGRNITKKVYSAKKMVREVTVYTSNLALKEGEEETEENKKNRRVTGIGVKWDDESSDSLGSVDHHTAAKETYTLDRGEFITEMVTRYHAGYLRLDSAEAQKEIFSLLTVHGVSFVTSKDRELGPAAAAAGGGDEVGLEAGLRLRLPSQVRELEKGCPGRYHWLQGFGLEEIELQGAEKKYKIFPIWGFQAHFKCYELSKQDSFEFVAGVRKCFQFSAENLLENPELDRLEDLLAIQRTPVHEVVELGDSDEDDEPVGSSDRMDVGGRGPSGAAAAAARGFPVAAGGDDSVVADDSVMTIDSDSDHSDDFDGEEEEEEEEEEEDEEMRPGVDPRLAMGLAVQTVRGGGGEPIEIASSSESEEEEEEPVE